MRKLIFILISLVLPVVCNAERIFPEEVLNRWGYETTRIDLHHKVKSIKNYGTENYKFYQRFELWRECFDSKIIAQDKINKIEEERLSSAMGRDKDYQRMIQSENCVYFVKTYSYGTFLNHQETLLNYIRVYISTKHS